MAGIQTLSSIPNLCSMLAGGHLLQTNPNCMQLSKVCLSSLSKSLYQSSLASYIEFTVWNTSSVLLSLHNRRSSKPPSETPRIINLGLSLNSISGGVSAQAVSLVVYIDKAPSTYVESRGYGLVAVTNSKLEPTIHHHIRIVLAGGIDPLGWTTMQFKGLWLSKGGSLKDPVGSSFSTLQNGGEGKENCSAELASNAFSQSNSRRKNDSFAVRGPNSYEKTFELITDAPSLGGNSEASVDSATSMKSFTHTIDWGTQLANVFNVHHTRINVGKYCLTKKCHLDDPTPTIQDIYFRSGPPGTSLFNRPWSFGGSAPDVLILHLGYNDVYHLLSSDPGSGENVAQHETISSFLQTFSSSYTTFIQSIRKTAYPIHPAYLHTHRPINHDYIYNSAPNDIRIFIVPPFNAPTAVLATLQTLVTTLRDGGDTTLFLLHTTGWLQPTDFDADNHALLAPSAHAKIAASLALHLCPYLSADDETCPFRRHDVYQGTVYLPSEDEVGKVLVESKIGKIKQKFGLQG